MCSKFFELRLRDLDLGLSLAMKRALEVFGEKLEVMILEVLANVAVKDGLEWGESGGGGVLFLILMDVRGKA